MVYLRNIIERTLFFPLFHILGSAMKVYLCEKASQGGEIAAFLGMSLLHKKRGYYQKNNIVITWTRGRLFKLCAPEHYCAELKEKWSFDHLPVIPEKFEYSLDSRAKSHFNIVKKLLKNAKEVYIATEPDPEGECIARNVLKFSGYKKEIYRILYLATDQKTLTKAFANPLPGGETQWMYQIALASAQSDWVIGMNLTIAMTLVIQRIKSSSAYKNAFPLGRVKTPAAMLVYAKEQAIKNFKAVTHYEIEIDVSTETDERFTLLWQTPERLLQQGRLLDVNYAKKAFTYVKSQKLGVTADCVKTIKAQQPPLPYDLTGLQLACERFDISPDETLEIAKSLYEMPLSAITYPKTHVGSLPISLTQNISDTLPLLLSLDIFSQLTEQVDLSRITSAWDDKKVKVTHGIIPTTKPIDIARLTQKQKAIYILVAKRYIAQFLPDHVVQKTNVRVKIGNFTAIANCALPVSTGWKLIEQETNTCTPQLPLLKKNQKLTIKSVRLLEKTTKSPERYTRASLAHAMENISSSIEDKQLSALVNENDRIGTVSIRPAIIKDLVLSGLLIENKGELKPSSWFERYMPHIPQQLKQPVTSALWERGFTSIENGSLTATQFVNFQAKFVKAAVAELNKTFMEIK